MHLRAARPIASASKMTRLSQLVAAAAIVAPARAYVAVTARPVGAALRPHLAQLRHADAFASEAMMDGGISGLPMVLLAEEGSGSFSVVDTLLDVGVYTLILLVAALTIYSLVVTLQKSNEEYGGWTPRDDEEVASAARGDDGRLRAGARYDPVTEQWTYPDAAEQQKAKVGRAPAAGAAAGADSDAGNRYERRMLKKEKKREKARKKKK